MMKETKTVLSKVLGIVGMAVAVILAIPTILLTALIAIIKKVTEKAARSLLK